jgi:hypothetical protein
VADEHDAGDVSLWLEMGKAAELTLPHGEREPWYLFLVLMFGSYLVVLAVRWAILFAWRHVASVLAKASKPMVNAPPSNTASHRSIPKCGTFAYAWNKWSAALKTPGVDLREIDRNLANALAEKKEERVPPIP